MSYERILAFLTLLEFIESVPFYIEHFIVAIKILVMC
jgi:hypothetical protein